MVKQVEKVSGFGLQVKEHGQCSGNCRQRERGRCICIYTYYTYTYTFYCIKNLLKWFGARARACVCVCVCVCARADVELGI